MATTDKKMDVFTFQFVLKQLNAPVMTSLPVNLFTPITVIDVEQSSFDTAKYQANKCYDNVVNTLLKNINEEPELKLCIGLHQIIDKPEQIVEHCWFEYDGVYFDFISEILANVPSEGLPLNILKLRCLRLHCHTTKSLHPTFVILKTYQQSNVLSLSH